MQEVHSLSSWVGRGQQRIRAATVVPSTVTPVGELPSWASRLVELRTDRRLSRRELARRLRDEAHLRGEQLPSPEHLIRTIRGWETGHHRPGELYRELLSAVYAVPPGALLDPPAITGDVPAGDDFDADLLELAARAESSDVSRTALDAVDLAVADLAVRYSRMPPAELLAEIRRRSRDVVRMLDGRATLTGRRRLLVAGGWLSLLAATVHVDLAHPIAARMARSRRALKPRTGRRSTQPPTRPAPRSGSAT